MKINVNTDDMFHSNLSVEDCLKIIQDSIEPCKSFRLCRPADCGGAPFAGLLTGNTFWLRFNWNVTNNPYWRLVGKITQLGVGTLIQLEMSPPILLWCIIMVTLIVLILCNLGDSNLLRFLIFALARGHYGFYGWQEEEKQLLRL